MYKQWKKKATGISEEIVCWRKQSEEQLPNNFLNYKQILILMPLSVEFTSNRNDWFSNKIAVGQNNRIQDY